MTDRMSKMNFNMQCNLDPQRKGDGSSMDASRPVNS